MKYLIAIIVVSVTFCGAVAQAQKSRGIPVIVGSVYDYRNLNIRVGKYSRALRSKRLDVIVKTASKMQAEIEKLTPAEMFVLAIRLYDLGAKDDATYWYYQAFYRSRLFFNALYEPGTMYGNKNGKTYKLWSSYTSFIKQVGVHVTGYAGCDFDNWISVIRKVDQSNRQIPDLNKLYKGVEFYPKNSWVKVNIKVSGEMQRLWKYMKSNKQKLQRRRLEKNMDAKFCNKQL